MSEKKETAKKQNSPETFCKGVLNQYKKHMKKWFQDGKYKYAKWRVAKMQTIVSERDNGKGQRRISAPLYYSQTERLNK